MLFLQLLLVVVVVVARDKIYARENRGEKITVVPPYLYESIVCCPRQDQDSDRRGTSLAQLLVQGLAELISASRQSGTLTPDFISGQRERPTFKCSSYCTILYCTVSDCDLPSPLIYTKYFA